MKQILQNLKTGVSELVEVPSPKLKSGNILIQTQYSLISVGTERMLVEFGKSGYITKANQQPEKVKQVLNKIKTDGLFTTIDAVRSKLDQSIPLGYCNVGVVLESDVDGFSIGDRVVSNGSHAEIVCAPKNLCSKIPKNVDDETAAFTVLGAIALQGIRLLNPTIGEIIAVQGLGLVGLLAVQILKANGCRVIGIDVNSSRCELAQNFGVESVIVRNGIDPVAYARSVTDDIGVDGVLVCTASDNNNIMHQAAEMCRHRGRIVLVGTAGLKLRRDDFFKKEISFQVSASYGPGRYDPDYEDKGRDYPLGFVRWTEQRNFNAVLQLMSTGRINVKPMITHRFPFANAVKAYNLLASDEPFLGIILEYGKNEIQVRDKKTIQFISKPKKVKGTPSMGFIGAGNHARSVLIPIFKKLDVSLKTITSSDGLSGAVYGKKFGFHQTTTNIDTIFHDNEIDAVVISTRHNTHAELVIKALESGKHVFVEKPLALTLHDLESIESSIIQNPESTLMVGFNRRFSPFVIKMKKILSVSNNPVAMIMTVNAGAVPTEHWTQDPDIGGGRIVGEACHHIDLLRFLVGTPIINYNRISMATATNDTVSLQLNFENGSIGTIHYFSNGNRSLSKERLEVFFDNKVLKLDNFRKLLGYGIQGFSRMSTIRQRKGYRNCIQAFINNIKTDGAMPTSISEIIEISRVSIDLSKH
jgi:predicted dehydrogenase/threonine dehydrogenase-like Zn-dependent dehydrogenase